MPRDDLEESQIAAREDRVAAVSVAAQAFFSTSPERIGRAQQLALALAVRSNLLRDYLDQELGRQEREHREAGFTAFFRSFATRSSTNCGSGEFADGLRADARLRSVSRAAEFQSAADDAAQCPSIRAGVIPIDP